jgi:rhamnosyltransferase
VRVPSPETSGQRIAAVVVTYNPDSTLERNLSAIREQVDLVFVIDNGSAGLAAVERAALSSGCRLVNNGTNLGVAAALNQGVKLARDAGAEWLATFDQDSLVPALALKGLLGVFEAHPGREKIAVLAMGHRDRVTGLPYHAASHVLEQTAQWRAVRATITSGSLVRLAALEKTGLFDERLFIDSVDHDFCLRSRARGLLVVEASDQVMDHSLGNITRHRFFWRTVNCTNHSPLRRYYITRNQLEVIRRHLFTDAVWTTLAAFHLVGASLATILYEPERAAKVAAMAAGVRDFLLRRFGPSRRA